MKVKVKVTQSCLTLCDTMDYTGVGSLSLLQGMDLPNPGIKPRSPTLQADFYKLSHKESPHFKWTILIKLPEDMPMACHIPTIYASGHTD